MLAALPLPLTDEQRVELERIARASSMPHRTVMQAKALLLASEGVANYEIARRLGVNANSVRTWRRRFSEQGVEGVGRIAPGRSRKSWLPEGVEGSDRDEMVVPDIACPATRHEWGTRCAPSRRMGSRSGTSAPANQTEIHSRD
jgi:Winged helix-turn helix